MLKLFKRPILANILIFCLFVNTSLAAPCSAMQRPSGNVSAHHAAMGHAEAQGNQAACQCDTQCQCSLLQAVMLPDMPFANPPHITQNLHTTLLDIAIIPMPNSLYRPPIETPAHSHPHLY